MRRAFLRMGMLLALAGLAASAQITFSTRKSTLNLWIPPDDGQVEILVAADGEWKASTDSQWLKLSILGGGAGNWKTTLSYECNPTLNSRTARLILGETMVAVTQTAGSVCPWKEYAGSQYSILYGEEFREDVPFVASVMERGLEIMRDKYKVANLSRPLKIFLHTRPNTAADQNTARTSSSHSSLPIWIDYLTPSAPEWKTAGKSSFLQDKNNPLYHRQTLIHEFTHVIQQALRKDYWYLPAWVYEGLAHYEGVFNSSVENRLDAEEKVGLWIKDHGDVVVCCQALTSDGIAVQDVYNGGTFFWHAVAESYGQHVHRRMFSGTNTDATKLLTEATGASLQDIFESVKKVYQRMVSSGPSVSLGIQAVRASPGAAEIHLMWTARSPWIASTDSDWLTFSLRAGDAGEYGYFPLKWSSNPGSEERTGRLFIGDATLTVTQIGAASSFQQIAPLPIVSMTLADRDGTVDLFGLPHAAEPITSNAQWLQVVSFGPGHARVGWTRNSDWSERRASISVGNGTITVVQAGRRLGCPVTGGN
ncbi:MAG: hypothetical protein N2255_11030 [Kiritimatiellae bacterium]|nr:hypothetical protein [Kiritimatiellia bacterium]